MKRIIKIDASSLKESACDLRFYNIVIAGYSSGEITNSLLYGSAVHKFIEVMFLTGGKLNEAVTAAKEIFDKPCKILSTKKYLTANHLFATCISLWQDFIEKDDFEYFHDANDKPAVEITFSIKIFEDEQTIIYLEGTIDKLGKIKNGCYAVGDYKTSGAYNPEDYFEGYRLSPQLKTYVWAFKALASIEPDGPFAKIASTPIGAFVDGIFLSPSKPSSFIRSEVTIFKEEDLFVYERLLMDTCKRIAQWKSPPLANGLINGACETKYGRCRYFNVCAAPDNKSREYILQNKFTIKSYQPLLFGKD